MSRFLLAELDRKAEQAVRIGRVAALDAGAARVRVAIGDLTTAWLPWLAARAGADRAWSAPEPGEQVVVLTPAGRGEQAVVLAGLYADAHPAPADAATVHRMVYADGAVIEYDRAAHALRALLPGGGTARIEAPGGVTIVGDLTVAGRIDAAGDVTAGGGGVSLLEHRHTNVQTGGGLSGPPQQ